MLAVGIGPIGPFEALIILLIVVLIFGVGKLSGMGAALGKSVRDFRKTVKDPETEDVQPAPVGQGGDASVEDVVAHICGKCGAQLDQQDKFCPECGAAVGAAIN